MNGWIKLHRCLLHNPIVMKDADHLAVWCYILLEATHQEYPKLFNGKKIMLQPGQLITGRKVIAETLGVQESKVKRILIEFESDQQIDRQRGNKSSLISIKNWDKYQGDDQQVDQQMTNKWPTDDQQVTTLQEHKNNKNSKNNKRFVPPTVEEVAEYIRQQGYSVDPNNFVDFYESKGWKVGKETMKDWKASVRTWQRRQKPKAPDKVHNFNERSDTDWAALELKLLQKDKNNGS